MSELNARPSCIHCGTRMNKWAPPAGSNWDGPFMFVCFNDECEYFVRGWRWTEEKYATKASYRYFVDPTTGASGPMAVWSWDALKGDIVAETEDSEPSPDQ
jgi:hypothetical protein